MSDAARMSLASAFPHLAQSTTLSERRPTRGQMQVLELLAFGNNAAQIAGKLGISREQVLANIRNARARLKARSDGHAIALAIAFGFLDAADLRAVQAAAERLGIAG